MLFSLLCDLSSLTSHSGPSMKLTELHESLKSKSFVLSSGVWGSQFILFVFHDHLIHLLSEKQLLRSSADKPSMGAPHLIIRWAGIYSFTLELAVLHCTAWKMAQSQRQPKAVEKWRAGLPWQLHSCMSRCMLLALGLRATRRWGSRSQHHCLLLWVATVWCVMQLCGGTVSALIRLAGRNPYTYRAHAETEHCRLNLHWEKTITVERMPCLFRNLPAVNIHYDNCCKVLIEQWIWLWYAVMLLLCICICVHHKGLSTIAWPRPLQTNPSL